MPALVSRPEQVTPQWLTDVLREAGALGIDSRVVAFDATPIGTGQVGANVRFALDYDGSPGPPTVVCKFASADPDSAAAGVSTLTYETEVAFYRHLADIGRRQPTPLLLRRPRARHRERRDRPRGPRAGRAG